MASRVDFKMSLLKDVMAEYREIKHVIDGVTKEKERLEQEKERFQHEKEMLQHEQHGQLQWRSLTLNFRQMRGGGTLLLQ